MDRYIYPVLAYHNVFVQYCKVNYETCPTKQDSFHVMASIRANCETIELSPYVNKLCVNLNSYPQHGIDAVEW